MPVGVNIVTDAVSPSQIFGLVNVGFVGVGFTVIVNVLAGPAQLFADGVTVNVPITGLIVEFVKIVLEIVPLPLDAIPIEDWLLVHAYVVLLTVPEKLIISDAIVLHFICEVIAATVGVGFTVIVNVLAGPAQLFAVGVTVNVAIEGDVEVFVNCVDAILLPFPLPNIPIELKLFVHENVAPDTELVKFIASEFIPLHLIWFATASTLGIGFTVTNVLPLRSELIEVQFASVIDTLV